MELRDLKSLTMEECIEVAEKLGEKGFRGKQLYKWLHHNRVENLDDMKNLPGKFRDRLKEEYYIANVKIVRKQVSKNGDTAKYLFELEDGKFIESVLMKYKYGNSVCISSQVGCRMGCTFCASTLLGLERSLTAGEMLSQIYKINEETGERVSNVIVMGMGEPMDNYDNLLRFIRIINDEDGYHLSQRNITVSTCGIVEGIRKLMQEKLQITLAISLHAPNDEIRRQTMPVANKYSMDEIFEACREYKDVTGRRVTFEYTVIDGVNDSKDNALELARRCKGMGCHINLIPLNEVKERKCRRAKEENIEDFKIILEKNKINVTIRREMGGDIDAACGQLRNTHLEQSAH
ncbi:23S rRNA (adenine(2503)-C(2))-methyltransferase RlmN [Eubacterium xylanophilum]|uniref:23S rRNA (adenine(2503)-C(2))-methyltransferase RlmN n=1 Tax=Eubacterium xylanophilum TaxID=39497 RepID=UPI00047B54CA|nr:23S rRNA (adenine(2503)-C(2))-methyltransferase RlmN [Eubacterium xylanophilum]